MDNPAVSVEKLADWQLSAMGATPDELIAERAVVAHNLGVARELGQLHLDIADGRCTGYVGWVRLTPAALLRVARTNQRFFTAMDDTPNAPVLFLVEQMNVHKGALLHRMRALSALPDVEVLAGWRGERLHVHRVRGPR